LSHNSYGLRTFGTDVVMAIGVVGIAIAEEGVEGGGARS